MCVYIFDLLTALLTEVETSLGTRHAGSKSNKCNGIDAVFEIDEAAKMSSNIPNDGSTGPDEYERYDESNIAIGHSCKKMKVC